MTCEETELSTLSSLDDDQIPPPSPGQSLLRPTRHRRRKGQKLRLRLVALTSIAFLALTAMALLAQQLFYRHFGDPPNYLAGHKSNATNILAQNLTRPPLTGRQLRHVNRTRGPIPEDYDFFAATLPPDVVWEVEDISLVDGDGFWSEAVENWLTRPETGLNRMEGKALALRTQSIVHLEPGDEKRCGGGSNGFVMLYDGSTACAHYREPHQQLVLGEVLSYYLSQLFGIPSLLPPVLSQVYSNSDEWMDVATNVSEIDWKEGTILTLNPMLESLQVTRIPKVLRDILMMSPEPVWNVTLEEAGQLAQWSDLLIFDYLTGNCDRVVRLVSGVEQEGSWEVLESHVPRLYVATTGRLWLLDNEAGTVDAYNLLYPHQQEDLGESRAIAERFQRIHQLLLTTFCIFRRQTAQRIILQQKNGNAYEALLSLALEREPLLGKLLERVSDTTRAAFKKHFQERVLEVWRWMEKCQS